VRAASISDQRLRPGRIAPPKHDAITVERRHGRRGAAIDDDHVLARKEHTGPERRGHAIGAERERLVVIDPETVIRTGAQPERGHAKLTFDRPRNFGGKCGHDGAQHCLVDRAADKSKEGRIIAGSQ